MKLSSISDVLGTGTSAKLGRGSTGRPETLRWGHGRPSWDGPTDPPILQHSLPRGWGLWGWQGLLLGEWRDRTGLEETMGLRGQCWGGSNPSVLPPHMNQGGPW